MKSTRYVRRESELGELIALLKKIFHVTKLAYLPQILQAGCISPNGAVLYSVRLDTWRTVSFAIGTAFPCSTFVRNLPNRSWTFEGAVSAALPGKGSIAILILKPDVADALVPWTRWREEPAWSEMVVPHVEEGYPGSLPTELIDEVICLALIEDPASLAASLPRHRRDPPDARITSDLPIHLGGLYEDNQARHLIVLQDDVHRTSDGFAVHIRAISQDDVDARRGAVCVSDQIWASTGSTDEERCNAVGTALVSWFTENRGRSDFLLHAEMAVLDDVQTVQVLDQNAKSM